MTQVFISYSRKDLAFVEQLATDLKAAGLDVWYDLSGLEGGARWSREIQKAIRESQYVLIVLSPDSVDSKWVEEEFLYASELGKKIIPLFYKKCALPFGYRTLHFIDIQGNKYEQKINEILRSLDVKLVAQKESNPPEESFPPGWDETWQPSFDKSYSASKKTVDRKKQPIKSETKVEKPKPKGKSIQQRWIIVPIIIVLIGAVLAGVFGLPKLFPESENTPGPTLTLARETVEKTTPTEASKVLEEPSSTPKPNVMPTQAFTATATSLPAEITDDFGVEMVLVPEGEFTMGSDNKRTNERPAHLVFLEAFYIDKYEVTNAFYQVCVEGSVCESPSRVSSNTRSNYYNNPLYAHYPVIYVNWEMAKTYCEWRGANLPTEAQWEKANNQSDFSWAVSFSCNRGNVCGEYGSESADTTRVGIYPPNSYRVYDMAGNVWEWAADWYSERYYEQSSQTNPTGPPNGSGRILRGGYWTGDQRTYENTFRFYEAPGITAKNIGFRCAKNANP